MTCVRSVVFSGYSGFHWSPRYITEIFYYIIKKNSAKTIPTNMSVNNKNDQGGSRISSLGGGAHLKNCTERREARKCLGYFVWKITILRQKILFFPIAEGGANIFGVFRVKNHPLCNCMVLIFHSFINRLIHSTVFSQMVFHNWLLWCENRKNKM